MPPGPPSKKRSPREADGALVGLNDVIARVAASGLWSTRTRARLLRRAGVDIGRARILPGIRFIGDPNWLRIGTGVFINAELLVGANAPVTIGDDVSIGPRCTFVPTTHHLGPSTARAGATRAAPIQVGSGCWLGAGVTVLSGVTIGAGTVVAAGAVVVSDCDPDSLYGGVPAKLIRRLADEPALVDVAADSATA